MARILKGQRSLLTLGIVLFLASALAMQAGHLVQDMQEEHPLGTFARSDTPISVHGNGELEAIVDHGEGTPLNPYVIENRTIDAAGSEHGIHIRLTTAHLVIRNCTVFNASSHGIYLQQASNVHVSGNTAVGNSGDGILLHVSHNLNVSGNNASYNGVNGIRTAFLSTGVTISGNNASHNGQAGIFIDRNGGSVEATGNTMIGCGVHFAGSQEEWSPHVVDTSNTVNGKPVQYHVNASGLDAATFTGAGQVILVNCNDSIVSGNIMSNATNAITLAWSTNITVSDVHVFDNRLHGIYLHESNNNTITNTNASHNRRNGIYLHETSNNTIANNNASHNRHHGIYLYESSNNTIANNNASHNMLNGIILTMGCDHNTVSGNNALHNLRSGVLLSFGSCNNTISGNDASHNTYAGISMEHNSNNNTVSLNNASHNLLHGIRLLGPVNNQVITSNNASHNLNYGILLTSTAVSNTITANILGHNGMGCLHNLGSDNTISGNLCPPGQVTGLVVEAGNGQLVLSWDAPGDGGSPITAYNVYRSDASDGAYAFAGTNTTSTGFVDGDVDDGATWYYMVSAVNDLGTGANSSVASATAWDVPGQVTGLVVEAGNGQLVLSWDAPGDGGSLITGYIVYWSTDNVTFTAIGIGVVTSYTHEDLQDGITRYYKVSAVNEVGEGVSSVVVSATTVAPDTGAGATVAVVIIVSVAAGIAVLFVLDKKGIINMKALFGKDTGSR